MGWPRKLYVATKTLGVFYAEDFSVPTTQPTWAAVNDGLPATDVRQFALDPFDPVGKQYLLLETARTLYRRDNGGDWAAILTPAAADTLCGGSNGYISHFWPDQTLEGRIWALYGGNGGDGVVIYALYSDDYGDNWTAVTRVTTSGASERTPQGITGAGDIVFIQYRRGDGNRYARSANKGGTWYDTGIGTTSTTITANSLQTDRCYSSNSGGLILYTTSEDPTNINANLGLARMDAAWFSATDADHHRIVHDGKLFVTDDSWDTNNTPSAIAPVPISIAPWFGSDEDQIGVELTLDTDPNGGLQPHVIGVLYGEDDTTAVGVAGAMCDESPYTDSIPMTCGGAAIGGIAAVEEATTEQPVPPDGEAITIPGNGPVILDGVANSQAVTMPGYTGTARGEPLPGDRGAWAVDTESHAKLHASDILAEAPTRHTPEPGAANQVVVSDGTKWTSAAVPTQDAADVTYTPTTLTDWDSDADPGNVDDALDQLAERVDDLEAVPIATTVSAVATVALAAGSYVNLYNDSGALKCRLADCSLNRPADGYVLAAYDAAGTATVYLSGINAGLSGQTIGAALYLSTAGGVTATAPSTAGYIVQPVGQALSATSAMFNREHTILLAS